MKLRFLKQQKQIYFCKISFLFLLGKRQPGKQKSYYIWKSRYTPTSWPTPTKISCLFAYLPFLFLPVPEAFSQSIFFIYNFFIFIRQALFAYFMFAFLTFLSYFIFYLLSLFLFSLLLSLFSLPHTLVIIEVLLFSY